LDAPPFLEMTTFPPLQPTLASWFTLYTSLFESPSDTTSPGSDLVSTENLLSLQQNPIKSHHSIAENQKHHADLPDVIASSLSPSVPSSIKPSLTVALSQQLPKTFLCDFPPSVVSNILPLSVSASVAVNPAVADGSSCSSEDESEEESSIPVLVSAAVTLLPVSKDLPVPVFLSYITRYPLSTAIFPKLTKRCKPYRFFFLEWLMTNVDSFSKSSPPKACYPRLDLPDTIPNGYYCVSSSALTHYSKLKWHTVIKFDKFILTNFPPKSYVPRYFRIEAPP